MYKPYISGDLHGHTIYMYIYIYIYIYNWRFLSHLPSGMHSQVLIDYEGGHPCNGSSSISCQENEQSENVTPTLQVIRQFSEQIIHSPVDWGVPHRQAASTCTACSFSEPEWKVFHQCFFASGGWSLSIPWYGVAGRSRSFSSS